MPNDPKPAGRLLIADDEATIRQILTRALASVGYDVEVAKDGKEAKAILDERAAEFDVAVLDIMMPGISGLDLVSHIVDNIGSDAPRILLASALGSTQDIQAGLRRGADDYIPKPLRIPEIRTRVSRLARLRQAERELLTANARMRAEIECASRIQAGLLPPNPVELPRVSAAYAYQPCEGLAGDFLNVQRIDDDRIAFFVADVCGHGVAASLVATWAATSLSPAYSIASALLEGRSVGDIFDIAGPAEVCTMLDHEISSRGLDSYLTVAYCILDRSTGVLRYCCGGHPPPMLFRADGSLDRLAGGGGPPVGMGLGLPFEDGETTLQPGDRLFIFTDGLTELEVDGEMFGEARLADLIASHLDEPLQNVVDLTVRTLLQDRESPDDLSLLAVAI